MCVCFYPCSHVAPKLIKEQKKNTCLLIMISCKWNEMPVFYATFLFCTVKAELGRGQPGLMRWNFLWNLPREVSIPRPLTLISCSFARSVKKVSTTIVYSMQFCQKREERIQFDCIFHAVLPETWRTYPIRLYIPCSFARNVKNVSNSIVHFIRALFNFLISTFG